MKNIYMVYGLLLLSSAMQITADWKDDIKKLSKRTKILNLTDKEIAVWGIPHKKAPALIATIPTGAVPGVFEWPAALDRIWIFNTERSPDIIKIINEAKKAKDATREFERQLNELAKKYPKQAAVSSLTDFMSARYYAEIQPVGGHVYEKPDDLELYISPYMNFHLNAHNLVGDIRKRYMVEKPEAAPYMPNVQAYQKELKDLLARVKASLVKGYGYGKINPQVVINQELEASNNYYTDEQSARKAYQKEKERIQQESFESAGAKDERAEAIRRAFSSR